MRFRPVLLGAALALGAVHLLSAQVPESVRAAVHRLYGTRDFASERFGPARWIENGAAYTTVEPSADLQGGSDIVRYETATGARSVLVSARQLLPQGATEALDFDDYTWSADAGRLLLFTNTHKVWRENTRGDYWVLDRRSGALRKLGGDGPASTMMYAKFSPTGDRVAFVRLGDLYVERLDDGTITRLTTGSTATLVNGTSDWVYEEEFGLRDGFRWSPDGARIAYWQFDMEGVGSFLLINDTDSLYPFTVPVQYPKAGTTNSAVRVGVIGATGGPTTWIQVLGDPRAGYVPWMEWAGPRELLVQHMNRLQNADDLLLADAATGAVRTVVAERDSAWIDLADEVPWLAGGGAVPLDQRARRVAPRLQRLARRRRAAGHARRLRRRLGGEAGRGGGLAVLHRLADQRHPALPLPLAPRRARRGRAGDAGRRDGHPRVRRLPRRTVGVPRLLDLRLAAGHRSRPAPLARGGAHHRGQPGPPCRGGAAGGPSGGVLQGDGGGEPPARRLDDPAPRLRLHEDVPGAGVRVRRTGGPDGA
jgi:hypothetical protein